jgi:hypothetical protein
VILHNPCLETELPKVVPNRLRILTPAEFDRLMQALAERHTAMLLTRSRPDSGGGSSSRCVPATWTSYAAPSVSNG